MNFRECALLAQSRYMKHTLFLLTACTLLPLGAFGAFEDPAFEETVFKAEVLSIVSEGERPILGTDLREVYQALSVQIVEGERSGERLRVENTAPAPLSPGDTFYLHRLVDPVGGETWSVGEPDRSGVLLVLTIVFVLITVLAAGMAGVRSLVALVASFLLIVFGLLPMLSSGFPPAITSVLFAVGILSISMFITHGFDRKTLVALSGSIGALIFAALLSEWAVRAARLSGFSSDEAVFLNFAADGGLSLPGLLLGGILVGVVGVLNDVSVSQVHTVAELKDANPSLSRRAVFRRAMKVGKEHMGAVVNTLPLAYAGASLPLLLLFSYSDASFWFIVNREVFSAEIIRALAGGVGLMLAGVIATVSAVLLLIPGTRRDTITAPKT